MALESKSQVLAVFELHLLEVIRNTYCTAIIFEHNLQLTYLKCLFGIINVEKKCINNEFSKIKIHD